jgi:hypothetical protein
MSAVLDFPPIDAPAPAVPKTELATAAHTALDLAKFDLTDVALAQFGDWRAHVAGVTANLSTLALDLSTQAKIDEAKSLRHRLIGQPRAEARKVSKELKSKLAKVSKAIGAEEDAAVAAYDEAEKLITPQIEARQSALDAEKEAARAAEAARVQKHQDGIATIRSYLGMAKGLPSSRIALGIEKLRAMTFGAEWEEFAVEAANAQCQTIEALRQLLAQTQEAEAKAAEQARIAAEHAAQQQALQIGQYAMAMMGKPAAAIRAHIDLLAVTYYPPDVPDVVRQAHAQAVATLTTMLQLAQQAEAAAKAATAIQAPPVAPVADGSQDSDDAAAIPGAKAGQESTRGDQREGMAPEACESAAGRGENVAPALATPPVHESPGVGPMGVGQPADAGPAGGSIETSEREAIEPPQSTLVSFASTLPTRHLHTDEVTLLLRDVLVLIEYLGTPFEGRFPTHPKPDSAWWAGLLPQLKSIKPRVQYAVGIPAGEA